jgi:hypothetical protein
MKRILLLSLLTFLIQGCSKEPIADFIFGVETNYNISGQTPNLDSGQVIRLTNQSSNAISYLWEFPDGTTSDAISTSFYLPILYSDTTLYFTLKAYNRNKKSVNEITKSVLSKATPKASAGFWIDNGNGSYLTKVYITQLQSQQTDSFNISNFSSNEPSNCDVVGVVLKDDLFIGAYTFVANDINGSYSGDFNVYSDYCQLVKINN